MLKPTKNRPPFEEICKALKYDEKSGNLIWRYRDDLPPKWNGKHAGNIAGSISKPNVNKKYVRHVVRFGKQLIKTHHIVWLLNTGEWPTKEIDHIDRNPLNNKFENLRESNRSVQLINASVRSDNTSGVRGVHFNKKNKNWKTEICINGKRIHLGQGTFDECVKLRKDAERKYFEDSGD